MALSTSPICGTSRVYQFISDPSHKENLSGRVRAACLTCRRKKIKCSGERNCKTCREKGIVCEGLPERKKPSRDLACSIVFEPSFGGVERKKKPGPLKIKTQSKKSEAPSSAQSIKSNDSGYTSGRIGISGDESSPTDPSDSCVETIVAMENHDSSQPSFTDGDSLPSLSPVTLSNEAWTANAEEVLMRQAGVSIHDSFGVSPTGLTSPTQASDAPMDWDKASVDNHWWSDDSEDDAGKVRRMYDTKALDGQMKALQQESVEHGLKLRDDQFRRQTVTLPVTSPGPPNPNNLTILDDMAVFSSGHTPGPSPHSSTARNDTVASWWDISADMTAMLGRGLSDGQHDLTGLHEQTNLSRAMGHYLPYDQSHAVVDMANLDNPPTRVLDCFGQRCA